MNLPVLLHSMLLPCALGLTLVNVAAAWSMPCRTVPGPAKLSSSFWGMNGQHQRASRQWNVMFQNSGSNDPVVEGASQQSGSGAVVEFTDEEQSQIEQIFAKCEAETDSTKIDGIVMEIVSTLRPSLVVKLRQVTETSSDGTIVTSTDTPVAVVAALFHRVLESRLVCAKDTLKELLDAGELRKLDAAIGSAARSGRLDVAFFNVLNINLRDAMMEEQTSIPTESTNESDNSPFSTGTASRVQILRHVYTRCQEEMEKTLPAGTALFHKLLRTEQPSIRANLYSHYLTPSATSITSPDGKVVELSTPAGITAGTVLVPLTDFIGAVDAAVLQIRTLENAQGTDRASAAVMVENCRQVAREARIIVGNHYGPDSDEVMRFEEGLQHVFRPSSPSSPYIQGQQV